MSNYLFLLGQKYMLTFESFVSCTSENPSFQSEVVICLEEIHDKRKRKHQIISFMQAL